MLETRGFRSEDAVNEYFSRQKIILNSSMPCKLKFIVDTEYFDIGPDYVNDTTDK